MKNHLLRWALLCVAASPGLLSAPPSLASQTVTIERGDSIDSLARRFHVSISDIARANDIDKDAVLVDGRKILIPDAPHAIQKPPTMHKTTVVKGDRITVRLGPDESYRRLTLLDRGVELIATRKAGDWYQIELPSGRIGWIKSDFVSIGSDSVNARTVAQATEKKLKLAGKSANESGESKRAGSNSETNRRKSARELRAEASRRHRLALAKLRRSHRADDEDEEDTARSKRERRRFAAIHARRRHASSSRVSRIARSRRSRGSKREGRPEADAPDAQADVVRTAYAYRGVPYHYGGTSRNGFDCSGFTSYIYRKKGVNLPHSAADQFQHGKRVSSGHLKAGDLVFFHTTRRGISHVGIYAGDGKFVHASSGGGRVRVDSLNSGYYQKRLVGARRVKEQD